MSQLAELRRKLGALTDELNTPAILADAAAFEAKEREIADTSAEITRTERAQVARAALARPVSATTTEDTASVEVADHPTLDAVASRSAREGWQFSDYVRGVRKAASLQVNPERHFSSFGEQLRAVARYAIAGKDPHALDTRLVRAPTGAGEVDPSAGGFLVQTDFATAIFMRAYDMGEILSRVQKLTITTAANSIKIPGVDETSRATGSRWGGVQSYWVGEGGSATSTKPKFRLIELDLKKLLANWYVTDEILADSGIISQIAGQAFSEEITFATEDAIVRGTGSGQPQGWLNSNAKVSVAKESGQAAKTIVYENILKMWSRGWSRSRKNAIWAINQDVEPQLFALSQVIGTAGVPVYLPANGISGSPYGTLFGRPVVPIEYAETLGTEGDISLIDLSQYVLADKGGVNFASSMHVAFLTDEMVFRITYRVDGESIWHAPLTPYKGTNTQSPFITLAAR